MSREEDSRAYVPSHDEIESVRVVLIQAGFPAADWSAEEVRDRWMATMTLIQQIAKAMTTVFEDLTGRFAETFRRLAVIAEEIERADHEDAAARGSA